MLVSMIATYYVGTRISRKIRESAAKDAMVQVHQSPCRVSMRPHFGGENQMFPFFFLFLSSSPPFSTLFVPFPTCISFLLLRWADEVCEETVGKRIANACQCQT